MKQLILAAAAALMVIGTAAPAAAAVNARQLDHKRLIDAGVRSGKLTPREAWTLRTEQRMIEREKDRLAADGYSRRDKRAVHARQDYAEGHIKALKNNGRRAPSKKILGAKVF